MTQSTILQSWARYTEKTNSDIINLLEPHHTRWEEETGNYFKTIKGILNHLAVADIAWFRRISEKNLLSSALNEQLKALPEVGPGLVIFSTWQEYKDLRQKIDQFWIEMTAILSDVALDSDFTYKTYTGTEVTLPLIGILLHLFNHQTHHRGSLSQILDNWGITNDYSALNKVFIK